MLALADGALYIASTADGSVQLIYRGIDVLDPIWSPDGSTIAFFDRGLYITDVRGENKHLLQNCDETGFLVFDHCDSARWSPDSQSLAYIYTRTQVRINSQVDLNIVDVASQEQRRLAKGKAPQWLPDSRHLAYLQDATFGYYFQYRYIAYSSYAKLCISPADVEAPKCRGMPPGHGNVLRYEVAR